MIMSKRTKNVTFNENYFEKIDTEEKAYFLGFIAADGCVSQRTKNCVVLSININKKDVEILEKFKESINFSGNIFFSKSRNNMCNIHCHSLKLTNDLSKYGIIKRKTNKIIMPKLIGDLLRHFMRGYFDGDGCVSIHKDKRPGKGDDRGNINIVSGSYDFIQKYVDILVEKANVKRNSIRDRKTGGRYYVIDWGGLTDVENIYNFLYKDAKTYLSRKKEKYDEVMKLHSTKIKYRKK